jgi:hypothetical protein
MAGEVEERRTLEGGKKQLIWEGRGHRWGAEVWLLFENLSPEIKISEEREVIIEDVRQLPWSPGTVEVLFHSEGLASRVVVPESATEEQILERIKEEIKEREEKGLHPLPDHMKQLKGRRYGLAKELTSFSGQ